jgi:hypothetical protein
MAARVVLAIGIDRIPTKYTARQFISCFAVQLFPYLVFLTYASSASET